MITMNDTMFSGAARAHTEIGSPDDYMLWLLPDRTASDNADAFPRDE